MASLASELLKRSGGKAYFRDARPVPKSDEHYVMFAYDARSTVKPAAPSFSFSSARV